MVSTEDWAGDWAGLTDHTGAAPAKVWVTVKSDRS